MSDELLAAQPDHLETVLTEDRIKEIETLLDDAVKKAERAMELIRQAVGTKPGPIPQDMLTSINQGAGYFRVPRDTIGRMLREFRKMRFQATCAHDRGLNHTPRRAFCKICELEFTERTPGNWVPLNSWEK